jgi:DNA-binding beta-propeller fold protein YncE
MSDLSDTYLSGEPWADFGLQPQPGWPASASAVRHRDVAGVAVGPDGNVYLFTRNDGQVAVFDRAGRFVSSFGRGLFSMPHGVTVDDEGCVYCIDSGDSTVRKFSPSGELLMTLGAPNAEADTGWSAHSGEPIEIHDVERVRHPGPPFAGCTKLAVDSDGDLFVSDGYRNCRIHRFSPSGELLASWGDVGSGPGEFRLPHALAFHGDRLLVADRENDRIQVFDKDGHFLDQWPDLQRPTDIAVGPDGSVVVSELWRPPHNRGFLNDTRGTDLPSRLSLLTNDGKRVATWGKPLDGDMRGYFIAPHAVAIDPMDGALYVAEVTSTFAIETGLAGPRYADHQIQRFTRRSPLDG